MERTRVLLFIGSPSAGIGEKSLNCMKEDCVCVCVCVGETKTSVGYTECPQFCMHFNTCVSFIGDQKLNIEQLCSENNQRNASGFNQYISSVQSNVRDMKLYDMSPSTFIFTILCLILLPPPPPPCLCCFLSPFQAAVGCVISECISQKA